MSLPPAPSLAPSTIPAAGFKRPNSIQLVFRDRDGLLASYIQIFKGGGLFVPLPKSLRLGEEIMLSVSLPGSLVKHPLHCKVAWITPAHASGGRVQGVGCSFADPDAPAVRVFNRSVEELLGSDLESNRPNHLFF